MNEMQSELRLLLVGIGGYAASYVREIRSHGAQGGLKIEGVVDPYAQKAEEYPALAAMGVPFYDTPEAFYAEHTADLAIISTPIPLHAPQAVCCMEHGSHVLCEKPIAGVIDDAQRMIEARNRTGKLLAIGFQWCYDPAMLSFRKDAQSGLFGELLSMRAIVLWPRDVAYYHRGSGWAGKKYDRQGHPIFDSVASNATAHYLENMLWVAGRPLTDVNAFTARANPIETYDTIVLRGRLGRADLTYVASHACPRSATQNPCFEYVFEKGRAVFGGRGIDGESLVVYGNDGSVLKDYGSTSTEGRSPLAGQDDRLEKLWSVVGVIRGESDEIACTAEDALLHARVMEQVNRQEAYVFPAERVVFADNMYLVPDLPETLWACYEQRALPNL